MNNFFLLLKNEFKKIYKKRKFSFFLFFFSISLLVGLFAPLFQFQLINYYSNVEFVSKSGKFDNILDITSIFKDIEYKEKKRNIEKILKQFSYELDYIYSPSFILEDDINNKVFLISSLDKHNNKFNKIVNFSEKTVWEKKKKILNDNEIIVNSKFIFLNEIKKNDEFIIKEEKFKISFIGERISDHSLSLNRSFEINYFNKIFGNDSNLFKHYARIFVSEKKYNDLLSKNNKKKNEIKKIYLKFNSNINKNRRIKILFDIKKELGKKKFLIDINTFDIDFNSGFKQNLEMKFNIFVWILCILLFLVVVFLFIRFIKKRIKFYWNETKEMVSNGISIEKFIISNLIITFIFLFFFNLISVSIGSYLGYFLYHINSNSSILNFEYQYFTLYWISFFVFVIVIQIFLILVSYIFQKIYYKRILINLVKSKKFKKPDFIFVFLKKWFPIFFKKIGLKSFIIISFFQKKLFSSTIIFVVFVLGFLMLFIFSSFQDFFYTKTFYPKNIKTFTEFDNLIFNNQKEIKSSISFVPTKETDGFFTIDKSPDYPSGTFNKIFGKIFQPEKIGCIKEIFKSNLIKNNEKKIIENTECKEGFEFKIDINNFLTSENNKKFIEKLKQFGIEYIFFNIASFDKNKDTLGLFFRSKPITSEVELEKETEITIKKEFILFLDSSSVEQNWTKLMPDLKDKLIEQGISVDQEGKFELKNAILKEDEEFILIPESLKYKYRVGDSIQRKIFINEKILFRKNEMISQSNSSWKFKIAGFLSYKLFDRPIYIVNYDFLTNNKIVDKNNPVFNYLFSSDEKTHLEKNMVIDINWSETNIEKGKFKIVNTKSLLLESISEIKKNNFSIYVMYFLIIFVLFIILLLILINSFSQLKNPNNKKLLFIFKGFKTPYLKICFIEAILFFFYISFISFISFLIGYEMFILFSNNLSTIGFNLQIYDQWIFLFILMIPFVLFFTVLNFFYNFMRLKKI